MDCQLVERIALYCTYSVAKMLPVVGRRQQLYKSKYLYLLKLILIKTHFANGFLVNGFPLSGVIQSQPVLSLLEPSENTVLYMLGGLRMYQVKSARRLGNTCMYEGKGSNHSAEILVTKMNDHSKAT